MGEANTGSNMTPFSKTIENSLNGYFFHIILVKKILKDKGRPVSYCIGSETASLQVPTQTSCVQEVRICVAFLWAGSSGRGVASDDYGATAILPSRGSLRLAGPILFDPVVWQHFSIPQTPLGV